MASGGNQLCLLSVTAGNTADWEEDTGLMMLVWLVWGCVPQFSITVTTTETATQEERALLLAGAFGGSVYNWSDRLLWHFLVEVCARVKLFTSQPEKGGKEEIRVLASLQTHPSDLNPPTSPQLLQVLAPRFCHIVGWRISLLLLELWGPHLWTAAEVLLACS